MSAWPSTAACRSSRRILGEPFWNHLERSQGPDTYHCADTYSYSMPLWSRVVYIRSRYWACTRMSTSMSIPTCLSLSGLQKSSCRQHQSQLRRSEDMRSVCSGKISYTSMLCARFLMTVTCSSSTGFRRKTFSLYGRTPTHERDDNLHFLLFNSSGKITKKPPDVFFLNNVWAADKGLHL